MALKRPQYTKVILLLISLLGTICWFILKPNNAIGDDNTTTVTWSNPIELSNPNIKSWSPTIASDMAGNVHIMWSQTMGKEPIVGEGDTLYYTRWDGSNWTTPNAVLVSPEGDAEFPELTVTPDGILHAVWGTGGITSNLMYAHAPACCAENPRSWSQPINIGGPVNLTTALTSDDKGYLHAAFASIDTGYIVYRRSDDGGKTWPIWVNIESIVSAKDDLPSYPRLAVDKRGRVHMVWSVGPWPGRYVIYSRSDDGGITWNSPKIIDRYDSGNYKKDYGPIFINVETYGQDEIHLMWDGAPTVERNHIWSSDGGNTWSKPSLVFPLSGVGRSGWNDMVFDSAGSLYAVALGQPWFASWSGTSWSEAVDIGNAAGKAEWVRISGSKGNQLHVVWALIKGEETINSVWYVRGQTSAPIESPRPLPTLLPISTPSKESLISIPPTIGVPTPIEPILTLNNHPNTSVNLHLSSPLTIFLISLIATSSVIGIVLGVRFWWSTRR